MDKEQANINQKIVGAAFDLLLNPIRISNYGPYIHEEPNYCLAAVRLVLEKALGIKLYGDYVNMVAFPQGRKSYWARDLEKCLRDKGMALHNVEDARPGDILCNHTAAYDSYYSKVTGQKVYNGHVAILVEWNNYEGIVFENVNPSYRDGRLIANNKNLVLSQYSSWGLKDGIAGYNLYHPTTVIRFDPSKK